MANDGGDARAAEAPCRADEKGRAGMPRLRVLLATMTVATATLVASSVLATQEVPADSAPLLVKAWVSTAGPYGSMWDLTIAADGRASLEVLYPFNPSGKLTGSFVLSSEALTELRHAVQKERFLELPTQIGPKEGALHMPDLRLAVQIGATQHKVALYDPAQVARLPTTRRFLEVWNKVYGGLPIKPTW